MKIKLGTFVFLLTTLVLVVSCGDKSDNKPPSPAPVVPKNVDIPDPNLRQEFKRLGVDANNDNIFTEQEMHQASTTIIRLNLNNKNIQNLKGVEYLTLLEELSVRDNQLKSFDINKLTGLKKLYATGNQLENLLDLSNLSNLITCEIVKQGNNPNLSRIRVNNHQLARKFNTQENTQKYSMSSGNDFIALNDPLKYCLLHCNITNIDADQDGQISQAEARATTIIDFKADCSDRERQIASLDGLEHFENLEILRINSQSLTSATIQNFSKLTSLEITRSLSTITLHNLPKLESLALDGNQFQTLTLTGLPALRKLSLSNNVLLTSLNINGLTELKELNMFKVSSMTSLDLSGLNNPEKLEIVRNQQNQQMTGIKMKTPVLASLFNSQENTQVYYEGTQVPSSPVVVHIPDARFRNILTRAPHNLPNVITTQDLQKIENLQLDNNVKDLTGIEHCTNLKELNISANVTTLNLTTLTKLQKLTIGGGHITTVVVGHLPVLREVYLTSAIQKVDFSDCPSLNNFKIASSVTSGIQCIRVATSTMVAQFEDANQLNVAGQNQNRNVFKTTPCN